MSAVLPAWLRIPPACLRAVRESTRDDVLRAMGSRAPGLREFAAMLSPAAGEVLEDMARRAQALTRRHFGRTVSMYVPLYLSNYCCGGCRYCGFASDRAPARRKLSMEELREEVEALRREGHDDVLLLTGERTPQADFQYLRASVACAAARIDNVTVEAFAMTAEEYGALAAAGATGITLYQETYDPARYEALHRWGEKRDYLYRLEAPGRALEAGMRTVGVGVLLGLSEPLADMLHLFLHAERLRRRFWRGGVMISFPRIRPAEGGYVPEFPVGDRLLARMIFACRLCLPDVPLVLSTRESAAFRDGIAGLGISRMSVASRTTVGGYAPGAAPSGAQFDVCDARDVTAFTALLRRKGLDPVFKNWDAVFQARE